MNMCRRISPLVGRFVWVSTGCVVVAAALIYWPSRLESFQVFHADAAMADADANITPSPVPDEIVAIPSDAGFDTVTRSDPAPLLQITPRAALRVSDIPISQRLRKPIRVFDTTSPTKDLPQLAGDVLMSFGHIVTANDRFQALLVQALSEWQSDKYINALLNDARNRGDFKVPDALITVSGQLDTPALLAALVLLSDSGKSSTPQQNAQPVAHTLQPSDSLAGLSLRYYGLPLEYVRIADANIWLASKPGQQVTIPTF